KDRSRSGGRIADAYDDWHGYKAAGTPATVELLAELAAGGPVLELGIGTGRLALPLAERGVRISGVDSSPAMIDVLRTKPGGDRIPVTVGDLADVAVDGRFRLIFLVY